MRANRSATGALLAAALATILASACTWIPRPTSLTDGSAPTDDSGPPGGDDDDDDVTLPPPTGEAVVVGVVPQRAGRPNTFDVAGASPGGELRIRSSVSAFLADVPGCDGLSADLDSPVVIADPNGRAAFELIVPTELGGVTVDYTVIQTEGCSVGPAHPVAFPSPVERVLDDADATFLPEDADEFAGSTVAWAGDTNGDGRDEVLIGASRYSGVYAFAGRTYLVEGPLGASIALVNATAKLDGQSAYDLSGAAIAGAGDVDGDGYDDVLVGASNYDGAGVVRGRAYLLSGPLIGSIGLNSAVAKFDGEGNEDFAGWDVGTVDADGDGHGDVLVGAPHPSYLAYTGDDTGRAYLIRGPVAGTIGLGAADTLFIGEALGDMAGHIVTGAGDLDGNGMEDVLITAPLAGGVGAKTGAAYVVAGPIPNGTVSLSDADVILTGEAAQDLAGYAGAGAGDVDGDGVDDLLIGADLDKTVGPYSGAAYLVLGTPPGRASLATADAKFIAEGGQDQAGYSVDGAGDVDGDGHHDLLIGALGNDVGGNDAGIAYLVYGPVWGELSLIDADVRLVGPAVNALTGVALAGGGDIDQDGLSDLLIGSIHEGAHLVYGSSL